MKYAVVKLQGKQYRVEEGMDLTVDRMAGDEKSSIIIDEVLMFVDGDKVLVGTPIVAGMTVKATMTSHFRGEKIRVATYKAKSKYRKVRGHRQEETILHIDAISAK